MATIVRVAHGHEPYAVIDRRPLEDERLSWAARGVMGYLLAKPDDWALRIENLRKRGDLGRDALYGILKQLRRYGYVERRVVRDEKGRIAQTVYVVYEVPKPSIPLPDNPDTAHPDADEPDPAGPTLPSKKRTKEPVEQITTTTAVTGEETENISPDRGGWDFPPSLAERERVAATARLEHLPLALAQALLDELAGRMSRGGLRESPLAYLRGLIRRAEAGQFTPEAGLPVAEARLRRKQALAALQRADSAALDLPAADADNPLVRRVAQIARRASPRESLTSSTEGEAL